MPRYLFPLSPFHKPGISSWHLLRKGEKLQRKKDRKRILGLMSSEEGRAFFGKGCCENARVPSGKEKEDWRDFFKVGCQVLLSKEVGLGHPCIPRVRAMRVAISDRA